MVSVSMRSISFAWVVGRVALKIQLTSPKWTKRVRKCTYWITTLVHDFKRAFYLENIMIKFIKRSVMQIVLYQFREECKTTLELALLRAY